MTWTWTLPGQAVDLGERPLVMGILNVTPDSFSDGGRFINPDTAIRHGLGLVQDGADIIDVGGESTRPGAQPVSAEEELRRVLPIVQALARTTKTLISVDTQKAEVARRALDGGASIVNDVSGLRADRRMLEVVRKFRAGVVLMHMQGDPATMQSAPHYDDVLAEVRRFFEEAVAATSAHGLAPEQLVLDPGIGFGKRLEHNLTLLANPDAFRSLRRPVLVGPSRKSLFGQLLKLPVEDREEATLASVALSVFLGARIVRVHDVKAAKRTVLVAEALRRARVTPLEEARS